MGGGIIQIRVEDEIVGAAVRGGGGPQAVDMLNNRSLFPDGAGGLEGGGGGHKAGIVLIDRHDDLFAAVQGAAGDGRADVQFPILHEEAEGNAAVRGTQLEKAAVDGGQNVAIGIGLLGHIQHVLIAADLAVGQP